MKRIVLSAALAASTLTVVRAQEGPAAVVVPAPPQSVKSVRSAISPVTARTGKAVLYGQGATPYALTASNAFDTTKVSPDIDNMKVGDAVKKVLEGAGKEVELDKDLPDTRVSIKAKDIRLGTFLDLMSQAAGAGWSIEMRDGKARYRFGKNIKPLGTWAFDTTGNVARALTVPNASLYNKLNSGNSFVWTDPGTGVSTFRNYLGAETRTSITCPHCKGKVTAIRTRTAPNCPKCSRTFQAGWDFCPADGTKRPADNSEWKHCPLCGKEVDFGKAAEPKKSSAVDWYRSRLEAYGYSAPSKAR